MFLLFYIYQAGNFNICPAIDPGGNTQLLLMSQIQIKIQQIPTMPIAHSSNPKWPLFSQMFKWPIHVLTMISDILILRR